MAPKTKRQKGKQPQEFDENKFVSFNASERFVSLMHNRKPIPKRGFTITERENPVIFRMIAARKWGEFVRQPSISITNFVREFNANAEEHRNGNVMVRGKTISFENASINIFYGLPNIENSEYIAYLSNVDYDEVCKTLCIPGSILKMSGGKPKTFPGTR